MPGRSKIIVQELKDTRVRKNEKGLITKILCDEQTPTDNLVCCYLVYPPGTKNELHYHPVEELQIIISGYGKLRDIDGTEYHLRPGTFFYCPAGIEGSHVIEAEKDLPMAMIYVYSSQGGGRVPFNLVEKK